MKTNDLRYTATKNSVKLYGKNTDIIVKIRLNDECKNGHQDFAITADVYKAGRRGDRAYIAGGCCHDEILKVFPEFKIFVNLHLSDAKGVSMYAVENGFYHLKNGFNSKTTGEKFKAEFCEYYRMTPDQFDIIEKSENKLEYAILLKDLGILKQWETEANNAIKILEDLTGKKFINDSKKSQYNAPEVEQIKDFEKKRAEGYFTKEQKQKRAIKKREQEKQKRFNDIKKYCADKIAKEKDDRDVAIFVLERMEKLNGKKGFSLDFTFDNFIFYNHTKTVKFNWRKSSFSKEMTKDEFKMFCESVNENDFQKLPVNISFEHEGEIYTNK